MNSTSSSPLGQETPDNVVEKVMRRVEVAKVRLSPYRQSYYYLVADNSPPS